MSAIAECYARVTNPFGTLGRFYDSLGHRGTDYGRAARQTVVAYEAGTVGYVGSSTGLGRVLGVKLDAGGYAGWAHLYDIRVRVGDQVRPGTILALVAGTNDSPGTLWSGAHIHTTLSSESSYAAALGIRPLADPAPRIARAVAASLTPTAPATGGGTKTPIEEDDMFTDADRALLQNVRTELLNTKAGIWTGGSVEVGGKVQRFNYGVLPIVAHNQTLIAQQSSRIAALEEALRQVNSGGSAVDLAAVVNAAEQGARAALDEFGGLLSGSIVDEIGERLSGA